MPGILPMKVIKVGTSAQCRIAQACDRCRSKKIRCDGIRPSCTQCTNVGFECKTSDKLSRRAFPRGYTESLEERVRALEAEVREFKDLLDEKDEKIDMLSRIKSRPSPSFSSSKRTDDARSPSLAESNIASQSEEDETFKLAQTASLIHEHETHSYFMGTSSARPMIDGFKRKLQEQGKTGCSMSIDSFFANTETPRESVSDMPFCWAAPARMLSDKLVNIFFQEFSPLFPIIHQPTFLSVYDDYISSPELVKDNKEIAQLFLVFGIAALSSQSGATQQDIQSFESQWRSALETFAEEEALVTVQCLSLATLFYMIQSKYSSMLKYKGHAVTLCQRIGLHQSQKRFKFGTLTMETRKKVFWTTFVLDSFSAAHLGLPTLLNDADVHCELPVDADDEYLSEKGFLPSLPGESTKLSSALALFKLGKLLSRILRELYPAAGSHELSFRKIASMQDELDTWSSELAPHLRLQFEKDKPSTGVISSRSPILSLAYHYTHSLLSRPAILASPSLQSRSNASILSLALSSKRMIQIVQLLQERNMAFAFCLNKDEVLIQSAFGLLFQTLEIGSDSAVTREDSKLMHFVVNRIDSGDILGAKDFRRLVEVVLKDKSTKPNRSSNDTHKSQQVEPKQKSGSRRSMKTLPSRISGTNDKASHYESNQQQHTGHGSSGRLQIFNSSGFEVPSLYRGSSIFARSEPSLSPLGLASSASLDVQRRADMNLDYMSFGPTTSKSMVPQSLTDTKKASSPADWERLLSNLDNGPTNIYDTIYGGVGAQPPSLGDYSSMASSSPNGLQPRSSMDKSRTFSSDSTHDRWTIIPDFNDTINIPRSVLSFTSDESPIISTDKQIENLILMESSTDFYAGVGVNSPILIDSPADADLFSGLNFNLDI